MILIFLNMGIFKILLLYIFLLLWIIKAQPEAVFPFRAAFKSG